MSRTITALFDTRADAEAGKERLQAASVHVDHVHIHDQQSAGYTAGTSGEQAYSTQENPGMWASVRNAFLPDEDRHTYEEGVRRGGFLLTADVDEDKVDAAVRALEDANSVDIDERSGAWRSQGWTYGAGASATAEPYAGNEARSALGTTGTAGDEQRLDVVEEQLVVGKREVDRGGVRVRSYVTEVPVHEQIRLRNERVAVERHPVDRAVTGDDAFRERSFEVTETGEEAVVGKTQRVVEEVVIGKTVEEHDEQIDDTVRRTDVEVEQIPGSTSTGRTTTTDSTLGGTTGGLGGGLDRDTKTDRGY